MTYIELAEYCLEHLAEYSHCGDCPYKENECRWFKKNCENMNEKYKHEFPRKYSYMNAEIVELI